MTSLTNVTETVRDTVRTTGDTVRTTVSEAESKVVGTVRDLQAPVAEYVHKGISFAGDRLPDYPSNLPTPAELIDSQYEFVSNLLSDQYDKAKAVAAKVAPLVGVSVDEPTTSTKSTTQSTASSKTTRSATSTKAAKASKSTKKAS
jgi:hypothetical protein